MFDIDINQANSSIQIKQNNSTIGPDRMVLVRITDTTISPDDDQKLHNLISVIHKEFGQTYSACVVLRFPVSFDK
jgi:hypothetical protein